MRPVVSIIIPAYNVSRSIGRCLESVISQTLDKIEVILVDDHGSDGSIEAAHQITDAYNGPIRFIYTRTAANSGPGAARNIGIEQASGKYIAFVDGDDSIDSEFCALLSESAERNCSDLCCCNLEMLDESGKLIGRKKNPMLKDSCFSGKTRKKFLTSYVSLFTTFLYRRTLFELNHIHFPDGRCAEDSAMLCCALLCCKRISQVNRCLYRYHRHNDSLTGVENSTRYLQRLSSMDTMLDAVRASGWYEADKKEIDYIYIKKGYLTGVFDLVATNRPAEASALKDIVSRVSEKIPQYEKNPYLRNHPAFKAMDKMITICPKMTIRILGLFVNRWKQSCQ